MAKRSHKRPVRHEKDQLGCMWGLINMFDFRHGRTTHRLLSDRRHSSKRSAPTGSLREKTDMSKSDRYAERTLDEGKTTGASAFKPEVKKLIEDILFVKDMKNESISPEEGNCQHHHHYQLEQQVSGDLDMDNLVEEFCHQIYQRTNCSQHDKLSEICTEANHKIEDFREKLMEVVKLLVSQKLINGDLTTLNGKLQRSKELMEALRILSSDEDLILKLLRDPNSLVVKYVPDLHDSRLRKYDESEPHPESNLSAWKIDSSVKSDELVPRKQRNFFRRKAKSTERNDLQGSDKIIILKPAPMALRNQETGSSLAMLLKSQNIGKSKEVSERAGSQFSLAEIKRKFKHAMGKEHHRISSGGISTIPLDRQIVRDGGMVKEYAGMSSPTKDHFFIERMTRPSVGARQKEKMGKIKNSDETSVQSKHKDTNIYVEAKKHLSDMLRNGREDVNSTSRRRPKTLEKILSLPEFTSSPAGSQVSKMDTASQVNLTASCEVQEITDKNKTEHASHLNPIKENSESDPCSSDNRTAAETKDDGLSLGTLVEGVIGNSEDETSPTRNSPTPEGTGWIPEATAIAISEVTTSSSPGEGKYIDIIEITDDHEFSKQYSCEGDQHSISLLESPPNSLIKKKAVLPETCIDVQEIPSPASVLEQPFREDVISPSSTRFQTSETSQKIRFEESDPEDTRKSIHEKTLVDDKETVFKFVKSLLEASSLSWDELLGKPLSSKQLLNPCLLDKVELPSNQLCLNKKLFFDCINEVLIEIQEHYFGSSLWVSSAKPDIRLIPNMKNLRQEICKEVYWHILPMPLPFTLDQIVRKDMAKSGTWLDLCLETDCIGTEVAEAILEDLMEDTILSYATEDHGDTSSTHGAEEKRQQLCT